MNSRGTASQVYTFYRDGFRRMTLGRSLWKIIILKLLIIFFVLKIFFFPDFLGNNFDTDVERSDHVLNRLTSGQVETP